MANGPPATPQPAESDRLSWLPWRWLLLLGVPLVTVHSFLVPDAAGFLHPEFARIFFWHFPCPILATGFLMHGAYASWKLLRTNDLRWDVRSVASHEIGMILIVLTMITGIFFSKIQWNAWWQNDPRQVSFSLVLMLYAAYFVVRSSVADRDTRAQRAALMALSSVLPFLFLTFVFPRVPQIAEMSAHPSTSIMKGQIKGGYLYVLLEVFLVVSPITLWIHSIRTRSGFLLLRSENYDGNREDSHDRHADPDVVRPVRLP